MTKTVGRLPFLALIRYNRIIDKEMSSLSDLFFLNQQAWEAYLSQHVSQTEGLWLRFDKTLTTSTLTSEQALDIALCYGWIDGQIRRIDDQFYIKYFSKRRKQSLWSTKNKMSVERLIKAGKMKAPGFQAVHDAQSDGRWERADLPPEDFSMEAFHVLIQSDGIAYEHLLKMSQSVQKTYALSYYSLKKEDSRNRRLQVILERLKQNHPPM